MATLPTTRILDPADYPRWSAAVAASPDGSVYSLPDYLDALCSATGGRFRVLAAERDDRIVGGIALFECSSRGGAFVSPRRLLYYNGLVLVPHPSTCPGHSTSWRLQTLDALERGLASQRYGRLRFKSRSTCTDLRTFQSRGWSVQPTYTYVVDIGDLATAWTRVDKNHRRLIGRCTEQGLQLTMDDDFDAFHHLHLQTHERKGAPLYLPREAFRRFVETLRERNLGRLYHARMPDGRVAASQLGLTGPHPVSHTVCAGAEAELLSLGASAFLRWRALEHLAAAGYRANDLTDAELNPVTAFKSQLGGELSLCLEVSRADTMRFRVSEWATTLPQRARRGVRRVLHRSTGVAE
jgi:hypothetical protein